MRLRAAILALPFIAMGAALAATPETGSGTAPPTLPPGQATPVTLPYDTAADAHAQVAAAFAAARASGPEGDDRFRRQLVPGLPDAGGRAGGAGGEALD